GRYSALTRSGILGTIRSPTLRRLRHQTWRSNMKRTGFGVVCVLLFPSILHAQAGTPKTPPPGELVAHFVDGSVIRRVRMTDSIDVQTRYGKLSVPIGEIRRIEFATRLSEETSRQVERAIDNLGSKLFAQREAATRE